MLARPIDAARAQPVEQPAAPNPHRHDAEPRLDVLGLGAVAVDDLLYVDEFPRQDEKTIVQARERAGGGLVGTALVAAARLGAQTAYCGVLGDDDLSRFTLDELAREGVDCGPVQLQRGAGPVHSIVVICRASGTQHSVYTANLREPEASDLAESLIACARVLLVDHTVPNAAIRAAGLARAHQVPIVADIEGTDFPECEAFLAAVDHLILGQGIASALTGALSGTESARHLLERGHAVVVVTVGAEGCWVAVPGQDPQHVPALNVTAVDTTGCGDVFHGVYAAWLAWGGSFVEAVQAATVATGLKATQRGGRAGIPRQAEVRQRLAQAGWAVSTAGAAGP